MRGEILQASSSQTQLQISSGDCAGRIHALLPGCDSSIRTVSPSLANSYAHAVHPRACFLGSWWLGSWSPRTPKASHIARWGAFQYVNQLRTPVGASDSRVEWPCAWRFLLYHSATGCGHCSPSSGEPVGRGFHRAAPEHRCWPITLRESPLRWVPGNPFTNARISGIAFLAWIATALFGNHFFNCF